MTHRPIPSHVGPQAVRNYSVAVMLLLGVFFCSLVWAQTDAAATGSQPQPRVNSAPVLVDGQRLFLLRGVTAYPAERRAAAVRDKIIAVAQDERFDPNTITVVEADDESAIMAGNELIVRIHDVDAELENIPRPLLADVYRHKIIAAVQQYRNDRSSPVLIQAVIAALASTAVFIVLLWGTRRLFRWLLRWSQEHVQQSVEELASKAHQLIPAGPIWSVITGMLRLVRAVIYVMLAYFFLNSVLGLFPWTRPFARVLFSA